MTLVAGTRLGPYEIQAPLGAGGMGEVYKARDSRLDRTVAIKVLPEHVAADPGLKQRFEREARALAALSHPHICPIHDVGRQAPSTGSGQAVEFLVMEYLEGQTLEERLTKGALPVDQALQIGIQMADALAAAHRAGIVHRDLKPGNIMLTRTGATLLDFGLARTCAPAVAGRLSMLPTTPPGQTQPGAILGTFQYMAPEQLEGQEADARTDLFAFGAVVYEMVTGTKAFEGKSQASLIAAILEREPPPMAAVQPLTPPLLDRVVHRCLAKDPERRFQSARDLEVALRWAMDGTPATRAAAPARRWSWVGGGTLIIVLAATGGFLLAQFRQPAVDQPVLRLQIDPPEGGRFVFGANVGGLSLSPDGRTAAYIAAVGGTAGLWVRSLDSTESRLVPGTQGAMYPFWSPDGMSIAFFAGGRLQRVDLGGGTPRVVADLAAAFRGGAWTDDGRIILGSSTGSLSQVPASGGTPTPLTTLDSSSGDIRHSWPQALPGARVLYWVQTGTPENTGVYASSLTTPTERAKLVSSDANAIYVPGRDGRGHLLWLQGGTLMAQPFDPLSLRLSGDAQPIANPVARAAIIGQMHVSASMNGLLLYSASTTLGQFAWFDRNGKRLGSVSEPGEYNGNFRLSPDASRAVVVRDKPGGADLWLLELERGVATRFTSAAANNIFPVWSPDGRTIVGSTLVNLFRKSSGGAGNEEPVIPSRFPQYATDWSQDGKLVLYYEIAPGTQRDVWVLPVAPDGQAAGQATPYLRSRFNESWGRFFPEPNPRWVAYQSDVSGRYEVYVDGFPEPRSTTRISTDGGQFPQWGPQMGSGDRELFYVSPDFKLMTVTLKLGRESVEPSAPRELFALPAVDIGFSPYDTTIDGQRFLVRATPEREARQPLTVIVNWPALLRQ